MLGVENLTSLLSLFSLGRGINFINLILVRNQPHVADVFFCFVFRLLALTSTSFGQNPSCTRDRLTIFRALSTGGWSSAGERFHWMT